MPKDIETYFQTLSEVSRKKLRELREPIIKYLPEGCTEVISYQMPTFKYKGKALVGIAGFKKHISYFPCSGRVMEELSDKLVPYKTSTGTLQIKLEQEIPDSLIRELITVRIKEIEAI